MFRRNERYPLLLKAVIPLGLVVFQNCGRFAVPSDSRSQFLSEVSVFDSETSTRVGSETEPSDPISTPTPTPTPPSLDVVTLTMCSNALTSTVNGNVMSTNGLVLRLLDSNRNIACTYNDPNWLGTLRNLRILKIHNLSVNCPGLTEGTYRVEIKGPGTQDLIVAVSPAGTPEYAVSSARFAFSGAQDSPYQIRVQRDEDGQLFATPANDLRAIVLYSFNPDAKDLVHFNLDVQDSNGCNMYGSPLLIRIAKPNQTSSPLQLTSPKNGVLFDILGENSSPAPHVPKRISWLMPSVTTQDYFLVLPNELGEVNGIDELFGDNTRGPDGRFAVNGYAALAKYDGRNDDGSYDSAARDGQISIKDKAFPRLRLWSDSNYDGVAQQAELIGLAEVGLSSIDLRYDYSYLERDQYGNETRFKSVAHTSDGAMHLVFDLWFVIGRD